MVRLLFVIEFPDHDTYTSAAFQFEGLREAVAAHVENLSARRAYIHRATGGDLVDAAAAIYATPTALGEPIPPLPVRT